MVGVRIEGRLGNQLFQYAFIYSVARTLNTKFCVSKGIERFILSEYFEIENDFLYPIDKYIFSIQGYKNIFSIHLKKVFYELANKLLFENKPVLVSNEESAEAVLSAIQNGRLFFGFFQSEKFFFKYKEDIKTLFRIKQPYINLFQEILLKNGIEDKQITVVHIRRGDYVGLGIALDTTYYHEAIKEFGDTNSFFVFISDDSSFVEKEFAYINNKYVSTNSEIIDFQFLLHANTCILSCSSFSWWGTYLNTNNPKVIVPKYWLGGKQKKAYPKEIILDNWIER